MYEVGYIAGKTVNVTCNNFNVSSPERADKLFRIMFFYYSAASYVFNSDSLIIHNFYFNISVNIRNIQNALQGAKVEITNTLGTIQLYTDSNGKASSDLLCYKVEFDPLNTDGHKMASKPFFSKTTLFDAVKITVTHDGYIFSDTFLENVRENRELYITLKAIPAPKLFTRILNFIGVKTNGNPIAGADIDFNENHKVTAADGSASFLSNRKLITNSDLSIEELEEVSAGVWVVADNVDDLDYTAPLDLIYVNEYLQCEVKDISFTECKIIDETVLGIVIEEDITCTMTKLN
jgi:hypothetical protein